MYMQRLPSAPHMSHNKNIHDFFKFIVICYSRSPPGDVTVLESGSNAITGVSITGPNPPVNGVDVLRNSGSSITLDASTESLLVNLDSVYYIAVICLRLDYVQSVTVTLTNTNDNSNYQVTVCIQPIHGLSGCLFIYLFI